jgi:hypothetical protein
VIFGARDGREAQQQQQAGQDDPAHEQLIDQ